MYYIFSAWFCCVCKFNNSDEKKENFSYHKFYCCSLFDLHGQWLPILFIVLQKDAYSKWMIQGNEEVQWYLPAAIWEYKEPNSSAKGKNNFN